LHTPPCALSSPVPPPAPPALYTLSLHDALPISRASCTGLSEKLNKTVSCVVWNDTPCQVGTTKISFALKLKVSLPIVTCPLPSRSEEHTSELQSRFDLVCRLLLEKKKT